MSERPTPTPHQTWATVILLTCFMVFVLELTSRF